MHKSDNVNNINKEIMKTNIMLSSKARFFPGYSLATQKHYNPLQL